MSFIYVPTSSNVGQATLTTGSALTAGQSVAVNSSGLAVPIAGYAQGTGSTGLVTNSGNTTQATWGTCSAYDTVNQRLVVFYQKPTTGDYYCKVGTLTSGTWTFGTEVLVIANTGGTTVNNMCSAVYNVAGGKIMFQSMYPGGAIQLIAGTVSGTTITFGTKLAYTPAGSNLGAFCSMSYDDVSGQACLGWLGAGSPYSNVMILSLSGTTITANTEYGLSTTRGTSNFVAGGGYAINILDGLSQNYYSTISGTTISVTNFIPTASNTTSFSPVYAPSIQTFFYASIVSSQVYITAVKYDGTTVTAASYLAVTTSLYNFASYAKPVSVAYDSSTGYVVMTWTPAAAGSTMQTSTYTISTVTLTAVTQFNALNTTTKSAYNQLISLNNGTLIYSFRDVSSGYTYSNPQYETTNTNYTGFIGFSSAAYGSGATATIQTVGSISTSQSGLTAGSKYYVQPDGTLTTTVGSNQYGGLALSAANLLIKG